MEIPFGWMAGVIDARGHIESHNRHGHVQPRVRVTTRKIELLEELARLTGNKVVLDQRGYARRPCGDHCHEQHSHVVRQSAQWTIDSARATIVLAAIAPLMVAQHDEALLALHAGLQRFPPARGDVHRQMAALGWPMPSDGVETLPVPVRHPGVGPVLGVGDSAFEQNHPSDVAVSAPWPLSQVNGCMRPEFW